MAWSSVSVMTLINLLTVGGIASAAFAWLRHNKKTTDKPNSVQHTLLNLMDNLPEMVYQLYNDEIRSLRFTNRACHALTGYPAEDLISGKIQYTRLIHPDDAHSVTLNIQSALLHNHPFTVTYRIITAEGEEKWVCDQGQGVYTENKTRLYIEGMITDITPRKRAERHNEILKNIRSLQAGQHEPMIEEILKNVLKSFACDRAWLSYPCDPSAEALRAVKEITRPEWPGARAKNIALPLSPATAETFKKALESESALRHDPETGWPTALREINVELKVQSLLYKIIKPKSGKPWLFGIDHCAVAHVFSEDEIRLFVEIGDRISDAFSSVLSLQELNKNEHCLSEGQRIAHFGTWDLNIMDNVLTWSDEIYRIFGLEPQQFDATYEAFLKLVHPDDRENVDRAYTQSMINRTPYDISHRLLLADGSVKHVNERCDTLYDASGNAVRSLGIVRDITEQKTNEEKLRQSAVAVNSTTDAIAVIDSSNRIIEVNRAYSEITGYAREEALGKTTALLQSGKHPDHFYALQKDVLLSKGFWQGEVWKRRKNGELFPSWSSITTVRDESQEIINYISVFSDLSPIQHSQEKLNFLNHHDPLTALPNRILFSDRLDHALSRAQRENKKLAIIFIDLDRFKKINDTLGHPLGDIILQQAAQRIKKNIRDEDTVARLGGDEFVVIMEEIHQAQDVVALAKKLLAAFNTPFSVKEHELHLSISMGISLYPSDAQDSETLIRNADTAMYRAKEEGRNDFQFYTTSLTLAAFERLTLETELHHALEENELVLHYQAQYSLQTERVTNVEALIRWNHPEFGLILPDKFIPFAEESGLILLIGKWVLETACAQMQGWLERGHALERVSVNVSGVQFQRGDIVETISQILVKTGLPASRLEIEITESAIMHRMDHVISILDELARMGVNISIDDFGTGYSSLSYLKRLPIHRLKIDKSFVRDIPGDLNDVAITRAINAIGQSLQIGVIAEGVETEAQRAFLKTLGCNEAQGYLYSRPILGDHSASFMTRL